MKRMALFVIIMLFPVSFLFAATYVVNPSGSIQVAIDLAASGDTIILADGTYVGEGNRDLAVFGKNLLIKSANGDPSSCVIDCEAGGAGFSLDGSSSITGLTITRAAGSGIFANTGHNVVIKNCILSGNVTTGFGGGLFFNFATGTIEDCRIFGNSAARGGGLALHSGTQTIINCVINSNQAIADGGGIYAEYSDLTLSSCLIADNAAVNGAGIFGYYPNSVVTKCDIVKNHGDGVWANSGNWNIDHTIIALNEGVGVVSSQATITCTDIWGNSPGGATGTISLDPRFCAPETGDYYLDSSSPCANMPECGLIGLYGVGCGPIGVEESTWGEIKNLYR